MNGKLACRLFVCILDSSHGSHLQDRRSSFLGCAFGNICALCCLLPWAFPTFSSSKFPSQDFPSGSAVETLLPQGIRFNPWCEKIPYAGEQLIPCGPQLQTPTLEPESHDHPGLEPAIYKNRSHRSGKPVHMATKSSVKYLPQLGKACMQQWKPSVAKINK